MTRMDTLPQGEPVTVAPMKTFPIIRDLVTDVSFNYEVAKTCRPSSRAPSPRAGTACSRSTSSAARSSASASSASCARTSATSSATTRRTSPVRRAAVLHPLRRARDAPAGRERPPRAGPATRARHVQHHQVLHRGVSRAHQDHRQRHHPHEGAGGRRPLRPGGLARAGRSWAGPRRRPRRRPAEPRAAAELPGSPWARMSSMLLSRSGSSPSTPHSACSTSRTSSPRPGRPRSRQQTVRSAWCRWSPGCARGDRPERGEGGAAAPNPTSCGSCSRSNRAGPRSPLTPTARPRATPAMALRVLRPARPGRGGKLDPADALAAGRVRVAATCVRPGGGPGRLAGGEVGVSAPALEGLTDTGGERLGAGLQGPFRQRPRQGLDDANGT